MIAFPLDNTEYTAEDLGAWFAVRTRGVLSADNDFAVTSNGNLTINVSPGIAWLKLDDRWGTVCREKEVTVLQSDMADGSRVRWDMVCIRMDKNGNTAEMLLKKSEYGISTPPYPLPVHNQDYDEIFVAAILRPAGSTSITPQNIYDLRLNETYCGVVRDGITGVPTNVLYNQFVVFLSELEEELSGVKSGALVMTKAANNPADKVGQVALEQEIIVNHEDPDKSTPTARYIPLRWAESTDDLWDKMIAVKSTVYGTTSAVKIYIAGADKVAWMGPFDLVFPSTTPAGAPTNTPPWDGWIKAGSVYQLVWSGIGFMFAGAAAPNMASTSAPGIAQLSTSTSSTSTTLAATPSAVKAAYDLAEQGVQAAYKETSSSQETRTITVPWLESLDQILNKPINIIANYYGVISTNTLTITGKNTTFGPKTIRFPDLSLGTMTTSPPWAYWVRAGTPYSLVWTGTYFDYVGSPIPTEAHSAGVGLVRSADNILTDGQSEFIPYRYMSSSMSVNLNDTTYRQQGRWTFYNVSTATNFPAGSWTGSTYSSVLETRRFYSNTAVQQTLYKRGTNEIWTRYSTSASSWGAWVPVITGDHNKYSMTSEVNTGKTWVNTKPIYRKIFVYGIPAGTANTWLGKTHGISGIDELVHWECDANGSGSFIKVPHYDVNGVQVGGYVSKSSCFIGCAAANFASNYSFTFEIEYTKT